MAWYSAYGAAAHRARGECRVPTRNAELEGSFECVQVVSGALALQVQADVDAVGALRGLENVMPKAAVTGTTSRGLPFRANVLGVPLFTTELFGSRPAVIEYILSEATIGKEIEKPTKSLYGLTNLIVTPNKQSWGRRNGRPAVTLWMEFNLPNHTVRVRRYPSDKTYKRLSRVLRLQKTCAITSVATTPVAGQEGDMDDLCALLSLAQGTMVNWLWREDHRGANRCLFLADRVVRPYTGLHVISPNEPGLVPSFVEAVFERFVAVKDDYRLGSVVRLMAEARSGLYADLESRGALVAVILELLTTAFAGQVGMTQRMPDRPFKRGFKVWGDTVRGALDAAYPGRDDIDEMVSSIKAGLNRPTFREVLQEMCISVGLPPDGQPVRGLVERAGRVRNKLIHEARFPKDEHPFDAFFFLLKFTDRLILKLLGFSGKHMAFQDGVYKECFLR